MKNPFTKSGIVQILPAGRADSACYQIAKEISYLYEEEVNKITHVKKSKR